MAQPTGKQVEFLSDDDLERFRTGDELAAAYDLVVFPGHAEYVTTHAYDVVERYRPSGGNLMFLSANFFWRVRRERHASKRRFGATSVAGGGARRRSVRRERRQDQAGALHRVGRGRGAVGVSPGTGLWDGSVFL